MMQFNSKRFKGGRVMRSPKVIGLALAGLFLTSSLVATLLPVDRPSTIRGTKGAPQLETAYLRWCQEHEEQGGDSNVLIGLGWSKAYSRQVTSAKGWVLLNLIDGTVQAEIQLGDAVDLADLYAVDNLEGPGRTAAPEPGDRILPLGHLVRRGDVSSLHASLGKALDDFEVDLLVAARAGKRPDEEGILFGAPTLFQRLFTRARRARSSRNAPVGPGVLLAAPAAAEGRLDKLGLVSPDAVPSLDPLIRMGGELFFNETFDGNGRTCGTCHPAEHNFTIDPEYIATLPQDNPLFVAEFVPELAEDFEKPELMRKLGLILENTNGFGDLKNNYTMRGVPHTLALSLSIEHSDGPSPAHLVGWSGDGAPGDGSLRQFAQGAIVQHYTKTLARAAGSDFRLATDAELDALEAFLRSLGRQQELDLSTMTPKSEIAAQGKMLFMDKAKCSICHNNAGASVDFMAGNVGMNFDTGVENLSAQPDTLIDPSIPGDDGFGSPGDGSFNTPVLVEAADTGPFFHNNSIQTIEGAVEFYNSQAFNNSSGADISGQIHLEPTEVMAVAAFLRVLNADENGREAAETADFILGVDELHEAVSLLKQALAEVDDAVEVLHGGGLHPLAQSRFRDAKGLLEGAMTPVKETRDQKIAAALERLAEARSDLFE